MVIDVPAAGKDLEPGPVLAQGWVTYGAGLPVGVRVQAGGLPAVDAEMRVARPDVAAQLGRTGPGTAYGWEAPLDLSECEFGPVTIVAEGLADGVVGATATTITVVPPGTTPGTEAPPIGALDAPADGDDIAAGRLDVKGWCVFPRGHVARVAIELDGVPAAEARLFVDHFGVADMFPYVVDATLPGFEATVDLSARRRGEVVVRAVATSLDGQVWTSLPHRVFFHGQPADVDGLREQVLRERTTARVEHVRPRGGGVLVVTHDLRLGGGQLWLWDLVRQLHSQRDLPCQLVAPGDGPMRGRLEDIGVPVHVTHALVPDSADAYEGRVAELALFAGATGCDVVLANTLNVFPAVDAAQRLDLPVVWAIHESFPPRQYVASLYPNVHPYVPARFEDALRQAAALVFEARQTSDLFAPLAPPERRFVVPYGVDLAEIDDFRGAFDRVTARREAGFGDDDLVVLVMGMFEPRKGHGLAVAAFQELAGVHDRLQLALVGAIQSYYTHSVVEQARRSGLAHRVRMVDVTPDVYRWYGMADLFLCPADLESLPRSVLEAMAFELPVVSTDVFGLRDLIRDDETGWLTQPRDLQSLVGAMYRVLQRDPDRWAEIGRAARKEVEANHRLETYGAAFAAALRRLVADPHADLVSAFGTPPERAPAEGG